MKPYYFLTGVLLHALFSASTLSAQSWEILYHNQALENMYSAFAFPGPDNGVNLYSGDHPDPGPFPIYSLDENGYYVGQSTLNWSTDWQMINVDNSGASYWITFYKLRKVSKEGVILWTYNPPVSAGILWNEPAPNGGCCLQYHGNNGIGYVIDYINAAGQLVNRFDFNGSSNLWPHDYFPGYDNSLIYTFDWGAPTGDRHWVKVNQQNQIVWEMDLNQDAIILSGSAPDGSTYYVLNDQLVKLSSDGTLAWQKSIPSFYPGLSIFPYDFLVRQDGSLILVGTVYDIQPSWNEKLCFVNLNPNNGNVIWAKTTAHSDFPVYNSSPVLELQDGGILACVGPAFNSPDNPYLWVIRTDANGNTLTNQIGGVAFRDENINCEQDAGESPLQNVSIIATSPGYTFSATSWEDGTFNMPLLAGNYTLSVAQPGSYWSYCNFPNPVHINSSNDTVSLPLGARAIVDCPELMVSLASPVFRRCFDNNYFKVQYHNYGTASAEDAYINITLPAELIYLSSTVPLASQNGQTYTFNLGTVGVGEGGSFTINFKVDCDVPLGDILCATAQIFPDTLCIPTTEARTFNRFCLPVVASYDPNDKTAFLDGKPISAKIAPDKDLEYLIRFQNTGTDTAFNIVITDTLTTLLDAGSVVPGASSHPYTFSLRDGKVLVFRFNNILLPDSNTNEAASHGFVKFSIKQKAGNPLGASLKNKAAIYFDFNDPVITNETSLVISNSVGTKEPSDLFQARVWPIPAAESATVQVPGSTILGWKLMDVTGKVQQSGGKAASEFLLQRKGLPAGIYWCQIRLESGGFALGRVVFE
jgi:uncharacterized repeat protein (TIGR01451 family)